jgi:acyl carrier protein
VDSLIGSDASSQNIPDSPPGQPSEALLGEIRALFLDRLDIRIESPDADLFQTGVFDSMTLVEFILALEEHFGLRFPMEELELDSVLSVVRIAQLVARRQSELPEVS